jgi:hypothetical protein
MRWLADRVRGRAEESEVSSGMLFATGLVAGGSIAGLLIVLVVQFSPVPLNHFGESLQRTIGEPFDTIIALAAFAALCTLLVRRALRRLEL